MDEKRLKKIRRRHSRGSYIFLKDKSLLMGSGFRKP
jgi:hypothetical protein